MVINAMTLGDNTFCLNTVFHFFDTFTDTPVPGVSKRQLSYERPDMGYQLLHVFCCNRLCIALGREGEGVLEQMCQASTQRHFLVKLVENNNEARFNTCSKNSEKKQIIVEIDMSVAVFDGGKSEVGLATNLFTIHPFYFPS